MHSFHMPHTIYVSVFSVGFWIAGPFIGIEEKNVHDVVKNEIAVKITAMPGKIHQLPALNENIVF